MKLGIHPLFFVFGLYFALTGKVFLFLTFTLTALIHEYGHAAAAEKLGYKMNKITLMPYGAVVNGAIGGLSYKDEISVALAGPLTNLAVCVLFVALWWIFPEIYPFTDTVLLANLSVASVNLLPAYPLDGGRILSAALSLRFDRKKVMLAMKISGVAIGVALLGLFVWSLFKTPNPSLLFFSLFILTGALKKADQNSYVRAYLKTGTLSGGIKESKRYLISGGATLKTLMSKTSDDFVYALDVVDEKSGKIKSLSFDQTRDVLASYRYYDTISQIIHDIATSPRA